MGEPVDGNKSDLSVGKLWRKNGLTRAVQMREAFTVVHSDGLTEKGQPGDWLCEASDGRRWRVDDLFFKANYGPAENIAWEFPPTPAGLEGGRLAWAQLAQAVACCHERAKRLQETAPGSNRETALAVTKLQEAKLWLLEAGV